MSGSAICDPLLICSLINLSVLSKLCLIQHQKSSLKSNFECVGKLTSVVWVSSLVNEVTGFCSFPMSVCFDKIPPITVDTIFWFNLPENNYYFVPCIECS